MQIIEKSLSEIQPYEKNPRKNDKAVEYVANSIKEFGFKVPIVIDKDGVIVAGHTRYKASRKLHLKTVPCIIADDLTEEQIKAYRLADNKVSEQAEWDYDLLSAELDSILDIDMKQFDFNELSTSYIDDLLENEFGHVSADRDDFGITILFPIEHEDEIKKYYKDKKEEIIAKIIEEAMDYA